jgi:hypothetical protein
LIDLFIHAPATGAKMDKPGFAPPSFLAHIRFADYSCGAFKINLAVDRLPDFDGCPSPADGSPGI